MSHEGLEAAGHVSCPSDSNWLQKRPEMLGSPNSASFLGSLVAGRTTSGSGAPAKSLTTATSSFPPDDLPVSYDSNTSSRHSHVAPARMAPAFSPSCLDIGSPVAIISKAKAPTPADAILLASLSRPDRQKLVSWFRASPSGQGRGARLTSAVCPAPRQAGVRPAFSDVFCLEARFPGRVSVDRHSPIGPLVSYVTEKDEGEALDSCSTSVSHSRSRAR